MKKAKFLIFLGLLVIQKTLVYAQEISSGATITSPDGISFTITEGTPLGTFSARQIADMITNTSTYNYNGPETQNNNNPTVSVTAINQTSFYPTESNKYLVGNASNVHMDDDTNPSFAVLGTNVTFMTTTNPIVGVVGIDSGASASIDSSITITGLMTRGGTLDQRGISSPLIISSVIDMKNAHLIFPLSQSGHVQSYLRMGNAAAGIMQEEISSVTLYNPFNAPLVAGMSYRIVQDSPELAEGQMPTLGNISIMDASGQVMPVTSFTYTPIFDGNGNCTVQFSLAPMIYNGHNNRQAGRTSTYSHQHIQTITGSALSVARKERGTSPSGYTGSFTSNPFKAPNLTDFMPITEGAQAYSTRETIERWSPLRTNKTGIWAQPFGMTLREVAQQGQPGFNSRTAGILFGVDHNPRHDLIIGGAIGYATTKQSLDENSGKTSVRDRFINIFASWFKDMWHLDGALLLGYEHYNQSRNVGNNVFALNHHAGFLMTPHIGAGYNFSTKAGKISVFSNFDYTYCKQFGYQETGANVNDLYVKSSLSTMLRSEVGTSISQEYSFSHVNWEPKFALSLINKQPIRKGNIITANGSSFEGSNAPSTDISPALYSTLAHEDGWSFSAGLVGEFGVRYNMGEVFLKFTKKLGTK